VILSTRHIKRGEGAFGMFGRPVVEVTAALDHNEEAPTPLRSIRGRAAAPPHPMAACASASASPAAGYGFALAHAPAASPRDTLDIVRTLDP
jgi:hypothetical protein